ncbi:predicted protein [Chaetoceros tenuissimus]|uniref:Uncharacterized protein n=1 Tax=Chaetoceros tenuissimus TaxID=426638 RepID=A0AAD3HAX1_9STRA|nr:predicted protein [Chaetoceros tenuissimus]
MESKTLSNNKANITESMQVRKQAWPSYDEARLYSEEEEENCKHKGTMKVFINIDPSGDFRRISNPRCTITRVEFLKTKQLSNGSGAGSRNTGCEDTFQYYFTAEGLVNENDAYSKYEPFAGSAIAFRVSIPFFLIGTIGPIILRKRNSSTNGEEELEDPERFSQKHRETSNYGPI